MLSEQNPNEYVKSAAAGVTEGFLNWSKQEIKELVKKFKNRDVAFIEDSETIESVRDYRVLCIMGLTLRGFEKAKKDLKHIHKKIRDRYGTNGLHIAYFVQNGLFPKFIANAINYANTPQLLKKEIKKFYE